MNVLKIVFFIILGFLPALGGLFTDTGAWYASLNKPVFNPPGWVFGPVSGLNKVRIENPEGVKQ